jgi:nucleoside-diphosphate-sugar epimerase
VSVPRSVVVLGGSGFVGRAVVSEAVSSGFRVRALARSDTAAATVASLGAEPIRGDVASAAEWITQCAGADAIIDLTQPSIPSRLSVRAITRMADLRVDGTSTMLAALGALPVAERPLWVSINGTDDLIPDSTGRLSGRSTLRSAPRGFAHIGLPVRAAIEASGVEAIFVYLGQMVYGPGKVFKNFVVEGIRTGKARMVGSGNNTLPLTNVDDVGAAVVHLLNLERAALVGRSVVAVPSTPATQRDLFALTAAALGRPVPGQVPMLVVALAAGKINAQVMTLDARCDPDFLTATGFTFRHETLQSGVTSSLAVMGKDLSGINHV